MTLVFDVDLSPENVVVAVATYRRPVLLRELLDSLATAGVRHAVIVDNDAARSAESVVGEFEFARYVVEAENGIAQARNTGLRELPAGTAAVIFVDDDERVESDWFGALIEHANRTGADVVAGPVVSHFHAATPGWIRTGGFIQRARYPSGVAQNLPATNNVLVRLEALCRLGNPWFDTAFSRTGGSDTDLFSRMRSAGASIFWADDAVVHEDVPVERATLKWLARREFRGGNVEGRLRLRKQSRVQVVSRGLAKITYGVVLTVVALLRFRRPDARAVNQVFVGAGLIGATTGRWYHEYRG